MATIVKHTKTSQTYVLLGSGFGAYQSKKPNWFWGDLMADLEEGQYAMICVCDREGRIGWLESSQVVVESVDGMAVSEAFQG